MKFHIFIKINACIFFGLSLLYVWQTSCIKSAVTYALSSGRFGDHLVSYCHAKWISYKYNVPLFYKTFEYSDQLMMHVLEIPYTKEVEQQFKEIIAYSKIADQLYPESGDLYVVPFFPETTFAFHSLKSVYFSVDWSDQEFKKQLQKMICPINPIKVPVIPEKCVSIAVHVRKGTGWDIPGYRLTPQRLTACMPGRIPPDLFYIDALKRLVKLFSDNNLYVYIFTDHDKPADLAQKYQEAVNCDRMIFDYRKTENNEFINVLEDFFGMTYFDCLIKADSHFSIMASKLGDYKVIISPHHAIVKGENTTIDQINFEQNGISVVLAVD